VIDAQAQRLIDLLGLSPHPEGGFYRETFRSGQVLVLAKDGGQRSASTAIYFLLPAGVFSAFHVIRQADEIWHHYGGEAAEIHQISPNGEYRVEVLGGDVSNGERPQVMVPAGSFQAAVAQGNTFALCGCTVTPGFDFTDLVMPTRDELLGRFPQHGDAIRRFTRT
jgi:uncharacterized protein